MRLIAKDGHAPARLGRLVLVALSCSTLTVIGAASVFAQEAGSEAAKPPLTYGLELGLSLVHFPGDVGHSEFASVSISRPYEYSWRFSASHDRRFGSSGIGVGASYARYWRTGYTASVGLSTGTSKSLHPRYAIGLSGGKNVLRNLFVSLSYLRWQSRVVGSSDSFLLGGVYYAATHWMIASGARFDLGHPGSKWSRSADFSITYYVYRKTYIGAGLTYADISYQTGFVSGSGLIEYNASSYRLSFAHFINPGLGFSAMFDYSPYWDSQWVTLRFFKEW